MLRSFFAKEEGQGLVEYALILVLIAVVVIGALSLLGGNIRDLFNQLADTIQP
ncbi:MAG: pilus assembly protein [Chloroflexus sp.]|uniref:Flp family type IVb pilin n=1 Tax=Chloroflexus sp. TaxID=1904827 RepID=UPI0021DD8145|nr:Flp family type IVb pilin [Chloroflexus sp.]GIV87423.1 MAG: pilus assembly protein [Chloroflexus sp.]GIV91166.1 MAG: pilus assembly protein [Chloroflexus sp.]